MPIDLESDEWEKAELADSILAEIRNVFRRNEGKAFSIKEIEEYLNEEHQEVFPADLVEPSAIEGAKAARQSIVATLLSREYWREGVTFRYVQEDDSGDAGLYFTRNDNHLNPIHEIRQVDDPDPDSPYGRLEGRFKKIEDDVDDVSDLKDRISRLEYRVQEELGMY